MKKVLFILLCIALFIGGCLGYGMTLLPSVDDAIATFHQQFNKQDFEYIYNELTSKEFKQFAPYQPYMEFMNKLYSAVGAVREVKRGAWGVFYKGVGLTFNVEYTTVNEKAEMKEYFTVVRRNGSWFILLYDPKVNMQ